MGRVFSYGQAAFGGVPTTLDFEATAAAFAVESEDAVSKGLIVGSLIFGSAAIHRTTPRSDFDCLIITDGSHESFREAGRIVDMASLESDGRVEVSAIPYSRDTLASGRHEIDRFFGKHLTGPERIVYGEDVADFVTFAPGNGMDLFNNYARNKKRRLSTTMVARDETDIRKGLQRLLELPLAIGRKLVKVVEETQETKGEGLVQTARKDLVRDASLSLFAELGLDVIPRSLLDADREYSDLLTRTSDGYVGKVAYNTSVSGLRNLVPDAIHWLNALDQTVADLAYEVR